MAAPVTEAKLWEHPEVQEEPPPLVEVLPHLLLWMANVERLGQKVCIQAVPSPLCSTGERKRD